MRILIIGGGIGGLTAAIALKRAGFEAPVYEQMRELREIGAGVLLGANAVRVIHGLGFAEPLSKVGMIPRGQEKRHWQTGALLSTSAAATMSLERYGLPSYVIHRADLHDVLRLGLDERDSTLGARCVRIEQDGSGVTAHFADGRSAAGDLLIGADGAESIVREYVTGPDSPIGPSKIAWRGLAPGEVGEQIGLDGRMDSYAGLGQQFLAYFVAGRRYVNWVGIMDPKEEWREASRFIWGNREAALADYAGWVEPVRTLIAGTEQVSKWVLYDGQPLQAWTRGRVTLLGDAAHPMLPFAGQGAGQSLEDAIILARCLEQQPDDADAALVRYFRLRRDRTAAVQENGRRGAAHSMHVEVVEANPVRTPNDWVYTYDAHTEPLSV